MDDFDLRCRLSCLVFAGLLCSAAFLSAARGDDPPAKASGRLDGAPSASGVAPSPDKDAVSARSQLDGDDAVLSNAERAARLERSLEADRARLQELQRILTEHQTELKSASDAFQQIEEKLDAAKKTLERQRAAGQGDDAERTAKTVADLQSERAVLRERFDLAINAVNGNKKVLELLQQKIGADSKALDQLLGKGESSKPGAAEMEAPEIPAADAPPASPRPADESEPKSTVAPLPGLPTLPNAAAAPATSQAPPEKPTATRPEREDVARARMQAERTEAAARRAADDIEQTRERIGLLEQNIELERQAVQAAERSVANAQRELALLDAELNQKVDAGNTPDTQLDELRFRIQQARHRLERAQAARRDRLVELERLQADRAALLAEELALLRKAGAERQRAAAARSQLERLQNPFTLHNIAQWLIDHGPKICMIVAVATLLHFLVRVWGRRIVQLMIRRHNRGTSVERENRARTLAGVFESTAIVTIVVASLLMVLDEVGIPVVPLLGGAAIVGLAVAFGAQNLIRDYFYGFMILLENQYGINDVVELSGVTGQVERITLRITVLRAIDGTVHFVPHGQVALVSNMTHGWSRAVCDIRIAYKEDIDRVMELLVELGRDLRDDPRFGPLILDDPEMLGVDALSDSAVLVKFFIKTRPLQQWTVRRELLRRIKCRFGEEGIEIPFPHVSVYRRHEEGLVGHLEDFDAVER